MSAASIHRAFDQLPPMDRSLDRPLAPLQGDSVVNSFAVSSEAVGESLQLWNSDVSGRGARVYST